MYIKLFNKIQTIKNVIIFGLSVSIKQTVNVKILAKLVNTGFVRIGCSKYVYHTLRLYRFKGKM